LALKLGQGSLIVAVQQGEGEKPTKKSASARPARRMRADAGEPAETESAPPGKAGDDLQLSAHYACTHCGLSFEPPSPQLFSFKRPQCMCTACDGLGELYSFDPELLVPDTGLSFKQGCFELLGPWRDMGRWRRHIYHGVADTVEHKHGLPKGTM